MLPLNIDSPPGKRRRFLVEASQAEARAGILTTSHGVVKTPAFMPVATHGAVRTMTPSETTATGASILLSNAYHIALRPGVALVESLGGLHAFMGWSGPILTDSGGFQIYSLGNLSRVTEEALLFKSYLDGSSQRLSPEDAIRAQQELGSDIAMVLDHCTGYGADNKTLREAMLRTHRWACRSLEAHNRADQAIFGIVQGGHNLRLREESAAAIIALGFDGHAVGGLSVGEPKELLYKVAAHTVRLLPLDKPRYLMGSGAPEDLVEAGAFGFDLFDCARPTRVARTGAIYTNRGRYDITSAKYREAAGPLEEECDCSTCSDFTTAYVAHLFRARELLAYRLATIHNLRFYQRLVARMRVAIIAGNFDDFRQQFHSGFTPANEGARLEQRKHWVRRNIDVPEKNSQ